jgi:hypothetical protein
MRQLWSQLAHGATAREIGQLVAQYPQYRDQAIGMLHRFVGNAYVQEVIAAASAATQQASSAVNAAVASPAGQKVIATGREVAHETAELGREAVAAGSSAVNAAVASPAGQKAIATGREVGREAVGTVNAAVASPAGQQAIATGRDVAHETAELGREAVAAGSNAGHQAIAMGRTAAHETAELGREALAAGTTLAQNATAEVRAHTTPTTTPTTPTTTTSPTASAPIAAGSAAVANAPGRQTPEQAAPHAGTVAISHSVGDGGQNSPADVRAVQDRLLALTYLSQASFDAEKVDASGAAPIAARAMPQTITALSRFAHATLGQPLTVIEPNQMSSAALNRAPTFAAANTHLTGSVGVGGGNAIGDVRAVQQRLVALGFLTQAQIAREQPVPGANGAVADAQLAETIAGIRRFTREVLASTLPQIRPGADEDALDRPPQFRTAHVDMATSVGAGATNGATSVRAVQDRLHTLGYLADAAFQTEQVNPQAQGNINAAQLTQTIAAIRSLQQTLGQGRIPVDGKIEPDSISQHLLMNPSLPVPQDLSSMTGSVGADLAAHGRRPASHATNHAADVQLVQGRLRELGFLSVAEALAEHPQPNTTVAASSIPHTIAAIRAFQQRVVGVPPDGRLDAGGFSTRLMHDPTYGTATTVNPNADNAAAGPSATNYSAEVQAIIAACEAVESGAGGGAERPAQLLNGSGTPASFGKAQMIGGTAVGTLQRNQNLAQAAGLNAQDLTDMNQIATHTATRFDAITRLPPRGGWTADSDVIAHAQAYITANGPAFHTETGLADSDIVRMFRTAQFIAQALTFTVQTARQMFDATAHPAAAANVAALGFSERDVQTFVANPAFRGEHKQGFVTKALFDSAHGQQLRDAMTDNGGSGIGRTLINDNFNAIVHAATAEHATLSVHQRAQLTAHMHNSGGTPASLVRDPGSVVGSRYVTEFDQHYRAP